MEWTVHELAERAGISGRTLRHYHQIGLLEPDRVGSNGYRYYGPDAVSRLQRILLLRETGMPLAGIAAVLMRPQLLRWKSKHLQGTWKVSPRERDSLDRRINAVEHTLSMRRQGREPRMDVMLEGFNDRYETEVVERWGRDAFDASNQWWHGKSVKQQKEWKARADALLARWRVIQQEGHELDSADSAGARGGSRGVVQGDSGNSYPRRRYGEVRRHDPRSRGPVRNEPRLPCRLRNPGGRKVRRKRVATSRGKTRVLFYG